MTSGTRTRRPLVAAGAVAAALLVAISVLYGLSSSPGAGRPSSEPQRAWANEPGIQQLRFETAPIQIRPGQNSVQVVEIPESQKPAVDGYIVRMRPDLQYLDGKVPPVDVLHLHHGVWIDSRMGPIFFGGEEKTVFHIPRGYGYPYKATDRWFLNQMIHNLWPAPARVRLAWDIDFIPATSALAKTVKPVVPVWMDVRGGESYPVFDTLAGAGNRQGTFTYPTDGKNPYGGRTPMNEVRVPFDGTIVSAVGHIHPGGLHDDIEVVRAGATLPAARACRPVALTFSNTRTARRCVRATAGAVPHSVRIFRSQARYFEPAGPVSWDFALTASRPDWRVRIRSGDRLRITTTYANRNISWYENMGIVLLFVAPGDTSGVDPFASAVDWRGLLTHGHLPENDGHGGGPAPIADARTIPSGPTAREVRIRGYAYLPGDLSRLGRPGARVPTVRRGQSLLFVNQDNPSYEWHTVTACRAPCNRSTGIAFPLADAPAGAQFDSGELGIEPAPMGPNSSPAAGTLRWRTPANLAPGTYTYFCRIHPVMRGAFRVVP